MPGNIPNIGYLSGSETPMQVLDHVAKLQKMVQFMMTGNLSSVNIRSLTANKITTGTLDAGVVTVRADFDGGAYIQLDSAGGLVINDGTKDTFHADVDGFVTMVGALIQSQTGYPRVELNSTNDLFAAYKNADEYVQMTADSASSPELSFHAVDTTGLIQAYNVLGVKSFVISTVVGQGNLQLSGDKVFITANLGKVEFENWDALFNRVTSRTLQDDLNSKANSFSGYTGNVTAGTSTLHFTNGILTSVT